MQREVVGIVVLIDQVAADQRGGRQLEQRDDQQRHEMERIEPREAAQHEVAARRALARIDLGEDEARNHPEHLHRTVAEQVDRPEQVIEGKLVGKRRHVDFEGAGIEEEVLVVVDQHRNRREPAQHVDRMEMRGPVGLRASRCLGHCGDHDGAAQPIRSPSRAP